MSQGMSEQSGIRWAALLLVLGTAYLWWPLWPPLLLAAWTAGLARPVTMRLERALHGRRRAAALLTVALVVGLGAPVALIAMAVLSGASDLAEAVTRSASARGALAALVAGDAGAGAWHAPTSLGDAVAMGRQVTSSGWGFLSDLAGAAMRVAIGVFLYFAGAYVLLTDGSAAWAWVRRASPLRPEQTDRLGAAFQETGRGLLAGVGLTTLTQGLVATIIYAALGVPRALVLGPLTGVASIVPVVGSAVVWGPLALGFLLNDQPVRAVILAALGVGVIGLVDNLLRPLFSRIGSLKLSLFVLFVSIFGGLATVGPFGVLLGPLVARLAIEALALLEGRPVTPTPSPPRSWKRRALETCCRRLSPRSTHEDPRPVLPGQHRGPRRRAGGARRAEEGARLQPGDRVGQRRGGAAREGPRRRHRRRHRPRVEETGHGAAAAERRRLEQRRARLR